MGQTERTQHRLKVAENTWNTLSMRIKAIKYDLALTIDGERKSVLEERLENLEKDRDKVEAELNQLEQGWKPHSRFIDIPFVIVAMTEKQASDLVSEISFNNEQVTLIEQIRFQALKNMLTEDVINNLLTYYGDERENWKLQPRREDTIKEIILNLASHINNTSQIPSLILPRFFSTDFFAEENTTRLKMWCDLSWSGCVLIVDAISLFHPIIYRQLLQSEMGANERVAIATILFSPLISDLKQANNFVKQEIEERMQRAFVRSAWYLDELCHHEVQSMRSFQDWFLKTLPRIVDIVYKQKQRKRPHPTGLQLVQNEVDNLGLGTFILGQGGQS